MIEMRVIEEAERLKGRGEAQLSSRDREKLLGRGASW